MDRPSEVLDHLKPRVSVLVPCRNEVGHIAVCLKGLMALAAPVGGFEIIVADGMSDDGTREILFKLEKEAGGQRTNPGAPCSVPPAPASALNSQPPSLRIIDNPGRIVSKGLNAALRVACGDIIVRLDAHTEYAPDYLCRCVETLERTKADNVGGPWQARGTSHLSEAIAAAFQSPFAAGGAHGHNPDYEGLVDTVYLGCWPRGSFEKFGFFDEELVRNQDDEHNLRITRGGGKVYQSPAIQSWYCPRGTLAGLFKQYRQYGYWKVRVIQKHQIPASWRHLVPGAFVLALIALFLLSAFCFLLSAGPSIPQPSAFGRPLSAFCFLLSAFSFCSPPTLWL